VSLGCNMKSNRRISPLTAWSKLMLDGTAMLMSSQEVIARRLWLMGSAGSKPGKSVEQEMRRMGTEKMSAGMESASAMAASAMFVGAQLGATVWKLSTSASTAAHRTRAWHELSTASARILGSGLKPISKRASSNARRLRLSGT
jgi:hypothetical protein